MLRIALSAMFLALLFQAGNIHASSLRVQEECVVQSERVLYRPSDAGFRDIAAQVNRMTEKGAKKAGLIVARQTMSSDFEYIHFDLAFDRCTAPGEDNHGSLPASKAGGPDCSYIGCQAAFPGNNMPIGSRMTIESCGGRVETIRKFKRVGTSPNSTGDDGIWEMTSFTTRAVSMCPSYQEP